MKKPSAITAGFARTRPNQLRGCLPMKNLIRTSTLVILLSCLLLSQGFIYCRPRIPILTRQLPSPSLNPSVGGFVFPDVEEVSNETILMYSQFNPAVFVERKKIKFLLEATEFGKIGMKEALRKLRGVPVLPTRRPVPREKANGWTIPFASRRAEKYISQFQKVSKMWLGDHDDFNPQKMVQDLVETAKEPRYDQDLAYRSSKTLPRGEGTLKGKGRHRSCAVVGNSGILLNGSHGEEIDRHGMVMRLNNAQTLNYTAQVGSKTTLAFMNGNVFQSCQQRGCDCHNNKVPIVIYICQAINLLHVAKCTSDKQRKPNFLVTHSLFDALCGAVVKWYSVTNFLRTTGRPLPEWDSVHDELEFHYSSGMQAVVLALGLCDSVDLYGFGKFANITHHYHTKRKAELSLHDYAAEYLFYDDLVHNRTIPFLSEAGISIPPVRIFY